MKRFWLLLTAFFTFASSGLASEGAAPAPGATCDGGPTAVPTLHSRSPAAPGQVTLTFDDGPHPGKTPRVLDLLREQQLTATFFLVGHAIRKNTFRLVQRMVAEGHTLGSHSYNHDVNMALRRRGPSTVAYIRGQHEVTQILIELALLAQSEVQFDQLFIRVFEEKQFRYLPSGKLRHWQKFADNHRALLSEKGYALGERPYPIVFSRPPGGNPYVAGGEKWQRDVYDEALRALGHVNVLWHAESGETHPHKKHDFAFLTENLRRGARRGGVLLIHDYIRTDALVSALGEMKRSEQVTVVPLTAPAQSKTTACSSEQLSVASNPGS